jgi:hypothetical protein
MATCRRTVHIIEHPAILGLHQQFTMVHQQELRLLGPLGPRMRMEADKFFSMSFASGLPGRNCALEEIRMGCLGLFFWRVERGRTI